MHEGIIVHQRLGAGDLLEHEVMQACRMVLSEHLVGIPLHRVVAVCAGLGSLGTVFTRMVLHVRARDVGDGGRALVERVLREHVDLLGQADEGPDL